MWIFSTVRGFSIGNQIDASKNKHTEFNGANIIIDGLRI